MEGLCKNVHKQDDCVNTSLPLVLHLSGSSWVLNMLTSCLLSRAFVFKYLWTSMDLKGTAVIKVVHEMCKAGWTATSGFLYCVIFHSKFLFESVSLNRWYVMYSHHFAGLKYTACFFDWGPEKYISHLALSVDQPFWILVWLSNGWDYGA